MPPYVAFRTWKTHLGDLKTHGVPPRIDTDVLKKMPGSTARQLKTGLRFLGLTDADDRPTDALHKLAAAYGTDQWVEALNGLLRARYSEFLSGFDLAHATPSLFREHFRAAYKLADEMARKSEGFFLQAAQEAGFEISKRIPIITRQRTGSGGSRRKVVPKAEGTKSQTNNQAPLSATATDLKLHPLLMELLRKIPPEGKWPKEERLRWFTIFAMSATAIYDDLSDPVDLKIGLGTVPTSSGQGG
jgi:hypothetical protein